MSAYPFKNKSLPINLSLLAGSMVTLFIIAEITTRFVFSLQGIDPRLYVKELKNSDRTPMEIYREDPLLNHALNPNAQALATTSDFSVIYKINSKGLRDQEYSYEKPPDKIRFLALGDSVVFGEGIPYGRRFTDIAEDHFPDIEIINMSVPAFGLDQIALQFSEEGIKYSPDYVILFMSRAVEVRRVIHHITENGKIIYKYRFKKTGETPTLVLNREDPFFREKTPWLFRHSYLLSYLRYQITLLRIRNRLEQEDREHWVAMDEVERIAKEKNDLNRAQIEAFHRADTEEILRTLIQTASRIGAQLILIKIDTIDTLAYLKGREKDFIYYDLTNALKQEGKKRSLSFKYDPHFNEETNRFLGEQLIEILKEVLALHEKV